MFITNNPKANSDDAVTRANLGERLNQLLVHAKAFDVLVGFFFFSGINAVEKALRENQNVKLRILVGMDAEICAGRVVEVFRPTKAASDDDLRERFLGDLKKVLGERGDTQQFWTRSRLFCELLIEGRLEIRKTRDENHAKLYLFEMDETQAFPHSWIMGSSNLSEQGLVNRRELNIEPVNFGYEEARIFFEELWESALPLTEPPEMITKIISIIKNESPAADISPYDAYLLLLKRYIDTRERFSSIKGLKGIIEEPKDEFSKKSKYSAFQYQMDAIRQSCEILEEYRGVIIADVVGLGKSILGSVIGRVSRSRGLVIAPPGLVGDKDEGTGWWGYLQDFNLDKRFWEVRSRGKMEEIAEYVRKEDVRGEGFDMIVVDEAHYFRNEDTIDYGKLSEICRGDKKIVLMTATPFSNRPKDVFSLLKLFMPGRGAYEILENGELEAFFDERQGVYDDVDFCHRNFKYLAENYTNKLEQNRLIERLRKVLSIMDVRSVPANELKKMLRERIAGVAKEIRELLERVMIRRNRLDLLENPIYKKEVGEKIAKVENPREQLFELSEEQSAFYDRVVRDYFGDESKFHGTAYRPIEYVKEGVQERDGHERVMQQQNMAKFIRHLLVRRFESSFAAFDKTLKNLKTSYENLYENAFARKPGYVSISVAVGRTLQSELEENGFGDSDLFGKEGFEESENIAELRAKGLVYSIDEDFDDAGRERFKKDLEIDIALMKNISEEVRILKLLEHDPKAAKLAATAKSVLAGELGQENEDPKKRKILVFSEFADTVKTLGETLKNVFPGRVLIVETLSKGLKEQIEKNFNASAGTQADDFDIMVATDKMSEGFNLNRAGVVVNYDIPWNPVRVIQRVGRINRIGRKVFEKLFIFNFFPTEIGSNIVRQREIAESKLFLIHSSIGEDSKIFSEKEEPTAAGLYEKLSKSPEESEPASFYTRAKKEWLKATAKNPEIVARIEKFSKRVKTAWKNPKIPDGAVYLFTQRGNAIFVSCKVAGMISPSVVEDAIVEMKCKADTPRAETFSENFWDDYEELQKTQESPVELSKLNPQSMLTKACRRINAELNAGTLDGDEYDFANEILEDIKYRRTLPEYTLREILRVPEKAGAMRDFLRKLRREIGSLKWNKEAAPLECLLAEDLQK